MLHISPTPGAPDAPTDDAAREADARCASIDDGAQERLLDAAAEAVGTLLALEPHIRDTTLRTMLRDKREALMCAMFDVTAVQEAK